jgi:putative transposase
LRSGATGAAKPPTRATQVIALAEFSVKYSGMSSPRRIVDDKLYAHFVTFSTYRRRRLLDHDHAKRIVLGVLNYVLDKHVARCIGFVIMPDHVHALVWFAEAGQLSAFMHEWKRQSSLRIRTWQRREAPNYFAEFGEGDRLWQAKYYAFTIYEQHKLTEKVNYMQLNPVRAGLVRTPSEWRWSSARWYELGLEVGVPIQWVD